MASKRMQLLIPEAMDNRLRWAADRDGVPREAWVRQAIEERLEREVASVPEDPLAELSGLNGPTSDICTMISEIGAGRVPSGDRG